MPKVLIFRSILLPISETFIKESLINLRRWKGVLVGMRQVNELPLAGLDILILRNERASLLDRVDWRLSNACGSLPRSVAAHLRNEGASLLHVHFGTDALIAWPIARALAIPMLVTLHGYDINIGREWWEAGHGGREMRQYPERLCKLALKPSVHFIAVSDAIRQRAISYGIPERKIRVCYIGVDKNKFCPGGLPILDRERRILFVGRLVEKKGCEYLIRAFAEVKKAVVDAKLAIVGDGNLRDSLRQLASSLALEVEFLGALGPNDIADELTRARVFCLPSVRASNGDAEGFGIVILEAQASGVPVVTSANGGATEGIVEGATGYSFKEGDVSGLASRLIDLLTNDRVVAAMSASGPHYISEKFDIDRCTRLLESVYDDLALHS